jgi:hypothetical protein
MPQNKNQHFVPRAHFKPFSVNKEGSAIHLYNAKADRAIPNAPLKGQCARDYFYGKDLIVEKKLRDIEGTYSSVIRKLGDDPLTCGATDLRLLCEFALLQSFRTEAMFTRMQQADLSMRSAVFRNHIDKRPPGMGQEDAVRLAMELFAESIQYLDGLKSLLIINRTNVDFITSDDPAIQTNRYHMQRLADRSFGIMNSGFVMCLPLTPRLLLMSYDPLVYTVPGKIGSTLNVERQPDTAALNSLQFVNCATNIYFSDWEKRSLVRNDFQAVAAHRKDPRHRLRIFIQVDSDELGEKYRLATEEEQKGNGPFMLQTSFPRPKPARWPTFLRFRDPVITYSNGSAAGEIRKRESLRSPS